MSAASKLTSPPVAGPDDAVASRAAKGNWLVRHFRQHPRPAIGLLCFMLVVVGIGLGSLPNQTRKPAVGGPGSNITIRPDGSLLIGFDLNNPKHRLLIWWIDLNEWFEARSLYPLHRRARETWERRRGPEHPDTLASLSEQAQLLYEKRDRAGAEILYRRVLSVQERTLAPEHPDTLATLQSLAYLLMLKNDWAGAEPLLRRALAGLERKLGQGHAETWSILSNLSTLLQGRRDWGEAEQLLRRQWAGRERIQGVNHPDTTASANGLANLLMAKGDLDGAEELLLPWLWARQRALGPKHPVTLSILGSLAAMLRFKGDFEVAESFADQVVREYTAIVGPKDFATENAQRLLDEIRRERMAKNRGR